jgi:ankyrin repeat protein
VIELRQAFAVTVMMGLCTTRLIAADATAQTVAAIVQTGSLEKIQAYLATPGVDINDRYVVSGAYDDINMLMDDKSLLDLAAEANQLEITTYLLDHGARVNAIQQQGLNQGVTALHRTAFFDAADTTELLIARGANINAKHGTRANGLGGSTPLLYAATHGSQKSTAILLDHGADARAANVSSDSPAEAATKNKHPEVAQLIADYLAAPRTESLVDAARNGNLDAVRRALPSGTDQALPNRVPRAVPMAGHDAASSPGIDRATLDLALRQVLVAGSDRLEERQEIMELLMEHGASGASLLEWANSPAAAGLLITRGANPKPTRDVDGPARGIACNPVVADPVGTLKVLIEHGAALAADAAAVRTMLRCAVRAHEVELAEFLVQQGAKADGRDAAGRTLLFDAPDAPMVDLLVKNGAQIDAVDAVKDTAVANAIIGYRTQAAVELINRDEKRITSQSLLLHAAARTGQCSVISALLSHGANINARDADGRTALYWAVYAKDYNCTRDLVSQGADINATDTEGDTVLHVAAKRNVRPLLLSYLIEQHANAALRDAQGMLPRDLATTDEARQALAVTSRAWDEPLSSGDASACVEVVRRTQDGSLGHVVLLGELPILPHDPNDNWDFLDEAPSRIQLTLSGRSYVLGSGAGPVYLSRLRENGVERVVCEFSPIADAAPTAYRVLGPGERLPGDLATRRAR